MGTKNMKQVELQKEADARLEAQKKLQDRIAELKACEGKTYIRKGSDGATTFKVLRYEGVGKLVSGQQAHLFRVERFNPGLIFTPPATQFLEEHEEVKAVTQTSLTNEIV